MEISPSHVALVIGAGMAVLLLLRNVRLGLRLLLTMARMGGLLCVLGLLGWLLGWWDLPRPLAILLYGLSRLLAPLRDYLIERMVSLLP